jgi:hypothetical protein
MMEKEKKPKAKVGHSLSCLARERAAVLREMKGERDRN